ncbi:N-formylglutamate amidohydrolase [Carboxylicivirga sp. N1Y90]|uniref:N-formylglutamate amidohydrolase n=1 Tax=Carboxylicivirga fragile TaxID=3417571 RepID=UPI003D3537C3|nr:N-formylglutamate amidohydrolase [Marinilabiliaceae bacterium N1Y90]
MKPSKKIILSCEHGGNVVPEEYEYLFKSAQKTLKTHRGYDIGAADLYESFKNNEVSYCQVATTSRLLVDINRSLYRRTLFSEFSKNLGPIEKEQVLKEYYHAYRDKFEAELRRLWLLRTTVLHVSVHSFTPELNGDIRHTDCGILYHPGRSNEKTFAKQWKHEINKLMPDFRVRFNYPYRGKPDGHVRYYRDREEDLYLGIEFELNQKHAYDSEVRKKLAESFKAACETWLLSSF